MDATSIVTGRTCNQALQQGCANLHYKEQSICIITICASGSNRSRAERLGGLLVYLVRDVHGLLRGVRVLPALVHLEVRKEMVANAPAGQHAPNCLLHNALRYPLRGGAQDQRVES